jgi:hypothetical protein
MMSMIQVQALRQVSGMVFTFSGPGRSVSASSSRADCGIAPYPLRQSSVIVSGRRSAGDRVRLVTMAAEFRTELRRVIPG